MGKKGSKPPPPPDPKETGQAQTATNVSTTIASAWLANPSQVTPFGQLHFMQRGQYYWLDPLDKGAGKQAALEAFQQWMQNNPPPVPPSPDLLARDPGAYQAAMDKYRQWEQQRNQTILDLAEQHGVNVIDVPLLTAYQALSPEQHEILRNLNDANRELSGTAAEQSAWLREYLRDHDVDLSNVPALPDPTQLTPPELDINVETPDYTETYGTDWSEDRKRVEEALLQRLEPQYEADRDRLRAELAAQGIWYGSEAYDRAMDEFNRKWNDARLSAILAGGKEQSRLAALEAQRVAFENATKQQAFKDALTAQQTQNKNALAEYQAAIQQANLQSQLRSQAMQEAFAQRGQPINEVISLIHGTQLREPKFVSANIPPIPVTDYAGIEAENYRARLDAWKAQQQFGLQQTGMILGFLGSLLSDPRKKKAVRKTGKTLKDGIALVTYRYKGEPDSAPKRIGVLASDVERKRPELVIEGRRQHGQRKGIRRVLYDGVMP